MIIVIDGPSGTGKSTVAKALALELGYKYFDTGAMYRLFALYLLNEGIDIKDELVVVDRLKSFDFSIEHHDNEPHYFLVSLDVTQDIRSTKVAEASSIISSYQKVRDKMVSIQREYAENMDAIFEGRDMASVVFPNANFKFYLDANIEIRAKRRYLDMINIDPSTQIEDVKKSIEERDNRDKNRENSPLICTDDAIKIDTSDKTEKQVIDEMKKIMESTNGS